MTYNGIRVCLSRRPRCPVCNTPNVCTVHAYIYIKWYSGTMKFAGL